MEGIRVIRVLEYEYANAEVAAEDMAHWTNGGTFGPNKRFKSVTLPYSTIEWKEGAETDG